MDVKLSKQKISYNAQRLIAFSLGILSLGMTIAIIGSLIVTERNKKVPDKMTSPTPTVSLTPMP